MKEKTSFKIGLIIPVFNVERTIEKVLVSVAAILNRNVFDILIIDNNSSDRTISIIQNYLHDNSVLSSCVTVLQNKANYGYGCSIKVGFDHFSNQDVPHIMVIHGDYQVEPAWLIKKLLAPIELKPQTDLVLASRFKPESSLENYSLLRKLGNYFFNKMTAFCSGHRMSDAGTAMIIIRNESLQKVPFRTLSNSWQFHPQLNILLYSIPGICIEEVAMDWADSDADSSVPLFHYGFILLKMLLLYWFKKNILKKSQYKAFDSEPIPLNREFVIFARPKNATVPDLSLSVVETEACLSKL